KISEKDSKEGCMLTIPTLDSKTIKWKIEGEVNLDGYRIMKNGFPYPGESDKRGDLVIQFELVPKDAPIEKEFTLTLEEIFSGCSKELDHKRKIIDEDGNESTENKQLKVEVNPGVEDGTRFPFEEQGDQCPSSVPADIIYIA